MLKTTFNDTYEVREEIGRGGMSTVYLAEHKRLHTHWAVKQVAKNQGARFDFLAESNILKRLQHPMLPRIVDIFEDEEYIYIVEDFVEGITLRDVLKRQGRVDEAVGTRWFKDLCGALNYLHKQKPNPIIYRDMKPSNIMLQPDGTLKLIDFGIAREYKSESNSDTTYVGTKGYSAPEQFGKAQTDARTDIYALGVTMYHLLTGKSPYDPPYNFVPVRQLVPELSAGIEHILCGCIQPEPDDRYQSVDLLLNDLEHSYRYDKAWQRVQRTKKVRKCILAGMLAASLALMAGGQMLMLQEKEERYSSLLNQASALYTSDYEGAVTALDQARTLYGDRPEPDRQQAYALYLNNRWQECIDFGTEALETWDADAQIRLTMASAQFELGDYESAAEGFAQGGELSADHLRDYAVCLGRLGRIREAGALLEELVDQGAQADVTQYVQGEVYLAQSQYTQAEENFLGVLEETESFNLTRRCYISLGDLYRDCAALERVGESPIPNPASRSAKLLAQAVTQDDLRFDTVLWEMLAMSYFEAYHTDPTVPRDYLTRAADCFSLVISQGAVRPYLYANLYTIYYELQDYTRAWEILEDYQIMFPDDYMPHALRGMLLITMENQKPQNDRSYHSAEKEYELADSKLSSADDSTYYQQLGNLIQELRANGWL